MNLAKLFKLPKKLGDSLLISLINNMVDYLRNYDSGIKVDNDGYIHLAADDLYLEANNNDIDIYSDSNIYLHSNGVIELSSNNNGDINLNSDVGIYLESHSEGIISLTSDGDMQLTTNSTHSITLSSSGSIYLNSNNENSIDLYSDAGVNIATNNVGSISLNSDGGITLNSNSDEDISLTSDAGISIISSNGSISLGSASDINLDSNGDINLTSINGIYLIEDGGNDIRLSTQNGEYDRDLILWSDSDGLEYRQNSDTYFRINSDGEILINENDTLFTLQNRLTTGKNGHIEFLFEKNMIDAIASSHDNENIYINGRSFSLLSIKALSIIEVNNRNYYYYRINDANSVYNAVIDGQLLTTIDDEIDPYTGMISVYNDLSGDISHDYDIRGASTRDLNNKLKSIFFTLGLSDTYGTFILLDISSFCYTADTLITLADGSTKQVKDITYDDELKVWNFDEGKDDVAKPLWIKRTEYAKSYQLVTLSDGNTIKLCGSDGKYHCMFDVTEQKFNHAVDCIGHEVYTENGIATVVSIEEVKEKVDHYNIVTNYHMNLYANHILTSTEKNNIYPIADMKFVKDDREIVPYEEFEKAHISREYYDGWRAGEWSEPLKDVITHLRRRKMYAKPQKRVKDGLRTDYFG